MSDEIQKPNEPLELSEQDLDAVAGGMNLFIASSFFHSNSIYAAQQTNAGSDGGSTASIFQSSDITSSAFELIALDVPDMDQLLGILGHLGGAKGCSGD